MFRLLYVGTNLYFQPPMKSAIKQDYTSPRGGQTKSTSFNDDFNDSQVVDFVLLLRINAHCVV